jgi:hypothetical protein
MNFKSRITQEKCETLEREGFVIIDDIFSDELANEYLNEMKFLMENSLMLPNKTQFATADGKVSLFTKPNIFELDLHHEHIRKMLPHFDELFCQTELVKTLDLHLPQLSLVTGTQGTTIKLQINQGNSGCFPLHYDNPGRPNKRQLTCLVYLNPNWKQGDGGELQLIPFLKKEINIPPLFNRMVIFYSDRVLHRVLPAQAIRYCFTIWIDGEHTNSDNDVLLKAKHIETSEDKFPVAVATLQQSPLQRVLSRSVYAEEYEVSLRECMEGAEGCDAMIASHKKHLHATANNPMLKAFVDACRSHRSLNS